MDIRDAQAAISDLRRLRKRHPLHFQALLDVAQGNIGKASQEIINDLKEWRVLSPQDGSFLNPNERDVLLAAGPELKDPYKTETITDKLRLAMADEEAEADFWRQFARLLKPKGGKKGRSRE
jgi:hypothetical protein